MTDDLVITKMAHEVLLSLSDGEDSRVLLTTVGCDDSIDKLCQKTLERIEETQRASALERIELTYLHQFSSLTDRLKDLAGIDSAILVLQSRGTLREEAKVVKARLETMNIPVRGFVFVQDRQPVPRLLYRLLGVRP